MARKEAQYVVKLQFGDTFNDSFARKLRIDRAIFSYGAFEGWSRIQFMRRVVRFVLIFAFASSEEGMK
jgi:hypothetical protein